MSHLNPIYAVWDDNAEAMAADIGEKGVTVRQWRNRDDIPSRAAQLKIIRAAYEKDGTVFRLEDFLSPEERRDLPDLGSDHGAGDTAADRNASATKADGIIGGGGNAAGPANNPQENICEAGGEGGHRTPFSVTEAATAASSPTSTTIPEQWPLQPASPTSSNSSDELAA